MRPVVLTLAGSDSSGGAGLQADARALQTLGCYAATVVTAVTAQNGRGVSAWEGVGASLIAAQAEAVLTGLDVRVAKTGLLAGGEAVEAVAAVLYPTEIPLVVDPVIGSTSGTRFLDRRGLDVMRELLLPRATLVTPNLPEAAALAGINLKKRDDVLRAAERVLAYGPFAVLIKGGHGQGPLLEDVLVTADGTVARWAAHRIQTMNTHGTGCTLASAIAAHLAHGVPLIPAIEKGRQFLQQALWQGANDFWGPGRGPAFAGW